MASLRYPDTGTRMVVLPTGRPAVGASGFLYSDEDLTVAAEAYHDVDGVKGSPIEPDDDGRIPITLDGYGEQPDYWGPVDGTRRLWLAVNGVVSPVDADYKEQIEALASAVSSTAPASRSIATTAPLTGGGDLSANRTLAVSDATTGTKGVLRLAGDLAGTAAAPTVPGKVAKGELVVNIQDAPYGAVGDCVYVDQRVSSGTWGLADAVPANPGTYGKGYTDSGFTTPATDNTTAFRAAWDAVMASGVFSFLNRDGLTGYRAQRKTLYIPAGAYYISNGAALFSLLRSTPSGTQSGIKIRGDGKNNTILYVRIPASGATDYLFYDDNWGNNLEVEGVSIVCTTGTERICYQTSSGNAKRWIFSNCYIQDYRTFMTVAGTVNADRWVFNSCEWYTSIAGACLHTNQGNTQALGFDFHSPSIAHLAGGNIFDVGAGGCIRIFGGTTDLFGLNADGAAGRFVHIHGNGASLGDQLVPTLTVYGHRFELHADAGLIDTDVNSAVFRDCTTAPIGNTRMANGVKQHVVARGQGSVLFEGGIFGDLDVALSTDLAADYPYSGKAHVHLKDAWIKNNDLQLTKVTCYTSAGDGLTTVFNTTGTGGGVGIGRLQVEGCKPYGSSYSFAVPAITAVNGAPFHSQSWFGRPPQTQRITHRAGNARAFGLPDESVTATITLPYNCELIRVGIVKQVAQSGIGGNSRTWRVRDGNGATLASLTALGTDTNVHAVSADILRVMTSANDIVLTLSCDAATPSSAGTGAEGYFFTDYI